MISTLTSIAIAASVACTNYNWEVSERCQAPVDYFVVNEDGTAWGALTSGVPFTQSNIVNDYTRLQRMQAEDAYWYISDRGVIHADSNIEALSIYLSIDTSKK